MRKSFVSIHNQVKGGVAYILQEEYGFNLPKAMHKEVALIVQNHSDKTGKEVNKEEIYALFKAHYGLDGSPFETTLHSIHLR